MVFNHFPHLLILGGFCQLPLILALGALCPFCPVLGKESAAFGTGLGEGFKVGGKLAIRVVAAAIEGAFLPVYPLH